MRLKQEVDELIDSILSDSIESRKQDKQAQRTGPQTVDNNKALIFDEIIAEDAKI